MRFLTRCWYDRDRVCCNGYWDTSAGSCCSCWNDNICISINNSGIGWVRLGWDIAWISWCASFFKISVCSWSVIVIFVTISSGGIKIRTVSADGAFTVTAPSNALISSFIAWFEGWVQVIFGFTSRTLWNLCCWIFSASRATFWARLTFGLDNCIPFVFSGSVRTSNASSAVSGSVTTISFAFSIQFISSRIFNIADFTFSCISTKIIAVIAGCANLFSGGACGGVTKSTFSNITCFTNFIFRVIVKTGHAITNGAFTCISCQEWLSNAICILISHACIDIVTCSSVKSFC